MALKRCDSADVEWANPTTTLFHLLERIRIMGVKMRPDRPSRIGDPVSFHVELKDLPCCKEYKKPK